MEAYNIDNRTMQYFQHTWRPSTRKTYATHMNKWALWAIERDIRILNPQMADVLKYLRWYFETGVGYGAINAARCALSLILPRHRGQTVGDHFMVKWFCKSCHEQRPPQPRYDSFWSVEVVLSWLIQQGRNEGLSLKLLSLKLAILLLLVSSQRGQTILNLMVDRMRVEEQAIVFKMKTLLKHNQLGQPLDSIRFYAFRKQKELCVVRTIKDYLKRTAAVRRGQPQLLLSYIGPHGPISRATLARWTLTVLEEAGVDTNRYKGHSTRGASASRAQAMGASLNAIMRNASWRDAKSFAVHYHKSLDDPSEAQRAILRRQGEQE